MAEKKENSGGKKVVPRKKVNFADHIPATELGDKHGLKSWELAGLMQFAGWKEGKQVKAVEFDIALKGFRERRLGG